ncbi:MAG: SAM-dependent methyltransferase [Marinilabiliales bacterium]|nr:MAG: SAM-dependent methyltransferase [Marinilabiliales bacterium]
MDLKNVYIKLIEIKSGLKFSFIYRYKKKDITKNFDIDKGLDVITKKIENEFKIATLLTLENDIVFERISSDKARIRYNKPSLKKLPNLSHDKTKKRLLESNKSKQYLHLLGISDEEGNIRPKSQDKYRQINNYIELLKPHLNKFSKDTLLNIADMGSGKGYLTFALYDFLMDNSFKDVKLTGVEYRQELVDLCNDISMKSEFKNLLFAQGNIEDYKAEKLDVLIALHACDTATDDAIFKGIKTGAELIIVAPCCQHQIRQEIEKSNPQNIFSQINKHGIFLERQAEFLTDGIRTLLLEYMGYKTKVVEFISDAHTHKNLMIIAEKSSNKKPEYIEQINSIKTMFGIEKHYLEMKLGI